MFGGDSAAKRSRLSIFGALALLAFVVHAANHVRRGEAHDVLWACNLAPLILAIGCFWRKPMLVAIPLLWLSFGTPMWLLDLATGGELIWTSFLPHLGGIPLGLLAARRLGFPKRAWLFATLALVGLMLLTRVMTPPEANVNLAFSVWKGWERYFPRYEIYFAVVLGGSALTFLAAERLFRKLAI